MSLSATGRPQHGGVPLSIAGTGRLRPARRASWVLLIAAGAWVVVVWPLGGMGAMPGTMGLGFWSFLGVWTLMMGAMMLPSVSPLAALYVRGFTAARRGRVSALLVGYLVVWAAVGVPAYALAWFADRVVAGHAISAAAFAVALFVACGVYQLTPLKDLCLARCRSPVGFLMRYSAYRGSTRDFRVGLHNGLYCVACCWGLMALLVAFGVMNLGAMIALAAVVMIEKVWVHGVGFSRAVGVLSLSAAAAVVWVPQLAPGLVPASRMMGM